MYRFLLLATLTLLPVQLAAAQGAIGDVVLDSDIPDLSELFRAAPPMGRCPIGSVDQPGMLPEGSHLLHLGVPRFYRDYRRRLQLTRPQVEALSVQQERAVQAWTHTQVEVDALEAKLWQITGTPEPAMDAAKATLESLSATRARQRLAYIDAVRVASEVLTPKQRSSLVGRRPASSP